jgi:hypothetical protein
VRKLAVKGANHATLEGHVHNQAGAPGQVNDNAGQCFVQRYIGMTIAANTFSVAYCLVHGLTECDTNVLDRVVTVNMKITIGLDIEVKHGMTGDLIEHVVKKPNAGMQPGLAAAIKIDFDRDVGLGGLAGDFSSAIHG